MAHTNMRLQHLLLSLLAVALVAGVTTPGLASTRNAQEYSEHPTLRIPLLRTKRVTLKTASSIVNSTMEAGNFEHHLLRGGGVSRPSVGKTVVNLTPRVNNDCMVLGEIMVGTPAKRYLVDFDTGSSTLWVFGQQSQTTIDIAKELVGNTREDQSPNHGQDFVHMYYNAADSQSYQPLYRCEGDECSGDVIPLNIKYADNDAFHGKMIGETLQIGNFRIEALPIGIVDRIEFTTGLTEYDGIFGLGRGTTSGLKSPFLRMVDNYLFEHNLFSLYFSSKDAYGEAMFGGVNSDRFSGHLTYAPVLSNVEWVVIGDQVMFGSYLENRKRHHAIDSGASHILAPSEAFEAIMSNIGQRLPEDTFVIEPIRKNRFFLFYSEEEDGCSEKVIQQLPHLKFVINGNTYTLRGRDYVEALDFGVCILRVVEQSVHSKRNHWTLGQPFLQKYYTVFDYDNHRIGFANAKHHNDDDASEEN